MWDSSAVQPGFLNWQVKAVYFALQQVFSQTNRLIGHLRLSRRVLCSAPARKFATLLPGL